MDIKKVNNIYKLINWFMEKEKFKKIGSIIEITKDEFCTIRRIVGENRNSFISIIINEKNKYKIHLSSSKVGVENFIFKVVGGL